MNDVRLQKFFTDCGVLSRRAAEAEIAAGHVTVNGTVATVGQKIDPARDEVKYKGRVISAPVAAQRHYVLLNKPRGFVTTLSDEKGRPTVATLVQSLGCRVYPVGRLDMDSDGLLLLTDDGELTNRLTHPRHEIPKHYVVTVKGTVTPEQLARLNSSFELDGYDTLPARVEAIRREAGKTQLTFELYEGRNRQIRKMCETQSLNILRLCRVAIGDVKLGNLAPGKWRYLTRAQVDYLKNSNAKK